MKKILFVLFVVSSFILHSQNINTAFLVYNFKAGEQTVFEDKFYYNPGEQITDHWKYIDASGTGSIDSLDDDKIMSFNDFNTKLKPEYFSSTTLPANFSLEYDTWLKADYDTNPGITLSLYNDSGTQISIVPNKDKLSITMSNGTVTEFANPAEYIAGAFFNRWVHFSIMQHDAKLIVYMDQYKMAEVINDSPVPNQVAFIGNRIAGLSPTNVKNVRIASSFPQLNFNNGKCLTRNIKFDSNKAILKPESITVINQMKDYLVANPNVKIEINAHTDGDGTNSANFSLSRKRADAIRNQLVALGINSDRLGSVGLGESVPIDLSNTVNAKAINRRIEFNIAIQ